MKLTRTQQTLALDWIRRKARLAILPECTLCGGRNWTIADVVLTTNLIDPATRRINYMDGAPLIALTCANCGHILLFSATQMGVLGS